MACIDSAPRSEATSDGLARVSAENLNPGLQSSLKIAKHAFDVTFNEAGLTWTKSNEPTKNVVTVPVDEILSVNQNTDQKSPGFSVCYIKHQKNKVLKRDRVQFLCSREEATQWSDNIQQTLRQLETRPKRLLVIINPESGNKRGRKIYDNLVDEIFKQANVETDLIVTERARHCEEILSTYDLSSIDGLVLFGGDGIYHEAVNGLQRRVAKEAGVDINHHETSLPAIPVPIGMIPTGSWNYIASASYGCNDVETAVLSIIIGKTVSNDMLAVYCKGELVGYAGVLVGYGYWGNIIYAAETNRWIGSFRYTMAVLSTSLVKRPRQMDLKVECGLSCKKSRSDITLNEKDVSTSEASVAKTDKVSEHKQAVDSRLTDAIIDRKTIQGVYIGAVVLVGNVWSLGKNDNVDNCARILMNRPCGVLQHFRFMRNIAERQTHALEVNPSDNLAVKEVQLILNKPSDPDTENGQRERIIDLDGEIYTLKEPECHIVYHSKALQLFTSI